MFSPADLNDCNLIWLLGILLHQFDDGTEFPLAHIKEESYCTHHKAPTMARQEVPFRNAQDPINYTFLLASQ